VVVHARKPASVITVAALLVGLAIAGPPGALAQDPPEPVPPYRIGYVSADPPGGAPAAGRDIWSADARGQDRTDATNRPGLDETDPAYSPDGTKLAYTEHGDNGALRVVVSDADGRNPKPLTGDAAPGREFQGDPTWSPDGTMIAFTYDLNLIDGFVQSIRIVRVADGQLLGEIPMPAHLQGTDLQPAWSPDGNEIALVRKDIRQQTPRVDPFTPATAASAGESFSVPAALHTPIVQAHPEIIFLMDNSGSMGDVLGAVKNQLHDVLEAVSADQADARFGLATYSDIIDNDDRFRLRQPLTADTGLVLQELEKIGTVDGGDPGEDWFNALYRLDQSVFTSPGTSRIVVLVGDAWSHEYCPPPPPPRVNSEPTAAQALADPCSSNDQYLVRNQVVEALQQRGIKLVAIPVLPGGEPSYYSPGLDLYGQASEIAKKTGGSILEKTAGTEEIAAAIKRGISALPVTVTPVPTCDHGLQLTFEPPSTTVTGGTDVSFTARARISDDAPVGAQLHCTTVFRFDGAPAPAEPFVQHLTVSVTGSRLPMITVEGRAAPAAGPAGAAITYLASAVDARGNELTPVCEPASGSTFPVGTSVVTCTATDGAGNAATASAVMTVFRPVEAGSVGIWLVEVTHPTPDTIGFAGQLDLSARIGEPCAGVTNSQPAWSPDGKALALRHDPDVICVVDADGGNARRPVGGEGAPSGRDPAWSPDGALIAFSEPNGEGHSRLWTVPAAGGEPSLLIDTPGGADQPAFRRMADLVLSARATPPSISVGDRTVLDFVVTNRGSTTAADIELSVTLPPGLGAADITTTGGSCDLPALRCVLGELAPLGSVTVKLGATGLAAGGQLVRASVGSRGEPNPADNEASVTVTVTPAAVPPVTPPPVGPASVSVDPPLVDRADFPGGSFTVDKTVHTAGSVRSAGALVNPDVVLLIDDTASMGGVIEDVRRDMRTLIDQVRAKQPSARFGVAAYRDESDGPGLDFRVEQQPIAAETPDQLRLLDDALGRLAAAGGGDTPEDWINALFRVGTDAVTFRPSGSKVVVLVGDAESHDPSLGHTLDSAIGALVKRDIAVIGVPTGVAGLDAAGQATAVANATRGTVLPPTSDPNGVAEAIAGGITGLPVTVTPVVTACDPLLEVTFTPGDSLTVPGGQDAKWAEAVRVADNAPADAVLHCTVEFRLNREATVRPGFTEQITIRVTRPKLAIDPIVGRPGTVVRALGTGFPAGAQVQLRWSVGISETPGLVTVRPDGTFDVQVLVFHNDLVGERTLDGSAATGPPFGVVSSETFLVVPRSLQPPSFHSRR
jgi:hypothetical protein